MLVFIDAHHKIKACPSSARHSKFLHMSKQMHIYVLGLRVSFSLLFLDSTRAYCAQFMVTLRYAITDTYLRIYMIYHCKVMALVNQSEIWQKYLLWFKLVGVLVWLC